MEDDKSKKKKKDTGSFKSYEEDEEPTKYGEDKATEAGLQIAEDEELK